MEITDVRLDVIDNPRGKLRSFCSITFGEKFVVKNFKVIEGNSGLFVAMPSRKLTKPCYECNNRVFRNANYCDRCGKKFGERGQEGHYDDGESHADIAFPIEDDFRERLEDMIIETYRDHVEGGGASQVEHQADEDYDLLDFDYEGTLDETSDSDETEEAEAKEVEKTTIPMDFFSDPGPGARPSVAKPDDEPGETTSAGAEDQMERESTETGSDEEGSPYY